MASSSYYYDLYEDYRDKAKKYGKNIESLQSIRNKLSNDFYDEQKNVNKELEDLKEDLEKSVRYDSLFKTVINENDDYKEKTCGADDDLKNVFTQLDEEITSLSNKKSSAESSRDYYHDKYEEEKEREHQEWLDSLKFWE